MTLAAERWEPNEMRRMRNELAVPSHAQMLRVVMAAGRPTVYHADYVVHASL